METSSPPSHDSPNPAVKRQVIPREPIVRTPRPPRRKQQLFLLFLAIFLLVTIYMILVD